MKTRTFILAAAALLTVACAGQNLEKKMQAFQKWNEDFMATYQENIKKMMADSTLDEATRQKNVEEYADKAYEEYIDYNKKVLSENKENALGVEALKNVYTELENEEVAEILNKLDTSLTKDPFIQKLSATITALGTTKEGMPFTDFEVDGVRLSDYVGKGKYILVDFWASWCGPCRREIPNIRKVYDEFKGDQFDVLSVAVWDKVEDTKQAIEEEGLPWPQIINAQHIPTDLYGIQGIPHIILFGPDGTIIKRDLRGDKIRETVAEYVK